MAKRFLNGININDQYTFPSTDGSSGQAIVTDGSGNLTFGSAVASSADSTESVHISVKNTSGAQILKGTPVYVTGETGNSGKIEIAPADASDSAKMPALGILESTLANNGEGFCVQGGLLEGLATDTIDGTATTANDTVYVKSGGGLTMTKPTGTGLIQNIAKVARVHASNGSLVVSSILRTNDVPNLTTGKIWVGDGNTVESTVVHLDETNGRMGIGTTSPSQKLEVAGNVKITDGYLQVNSTAGANVYASPVSKSVEIWAVSSELGGDPAFRIRQDSTTKVDFGWDDDGTSEAFIWNYSNGGFKIGTNGSERFKITSTGNVGIGTTSPNGTLTVVSNNAYNSGGGLRLQSSSGVDRTLLYLSTDHTNQVSTIQSYRDGTGAGVKNLLINPQGGNVGIGTTSPSQRLDVRSGSFNSSVAQFTGANDGRGLLISTFSRASNDDSVDYNAQYSGLGVQTWSINNSEKMRLDQNGNVGIGTPTPTTPLHIRANEPSIRLQDITSADNHYLTGNNGELRVQTSGYMTMRPGNTVSTTFLANGNVGIGTTSPARKLEVYNGSSSMISQFRSGSGTSSFICFANTGSTADQVRIGSISTNLVLSTNYTERMRITSTGNVGIGTTSPSEKLHVFGGAAAIEIDSTTNEAALKYDNSTTTATIKLANNDLKTELGGSEKMRITSAGNVGIGTTSPSDKLHVIGNATISGETTFKPKHYGASDDLNNDNRSIFSTHATGNTTTNRPINYSTVYTLGGSVSNALQISTNEDYSESGMWIRQYNQNPSSPQGTGWQNWTEVWTTNHAPLSKIANWDAAYTYSQVGHLQLSGGTLSGNLTVQGTTILDSLQLEASSDYITFYGGNSTQHSITSRQLDGQPADDLRFNTYGSFIINLDSNNNQNNAANSSFYIARHGGSSGDLSSNILFDIDGENGDATFTGNVGIGVVPADRNVLDIRSDDTNGVFVTHRNNDGFFLNRTYADYGNDGNTVEYQERIGVDGNRSSIGNFSNHTLGIKTNNQDRITVLAGGNVGINNTNPEAKLDVRPDNGNGKVLRVGNYSVSTYSYSTQADATIDLTCGSYYQAEVIITANQTNGGDYNNIYIRGIWSNNHTTHHWDEIESIGFLTGSSIGITVGENTISNSGKLSIDFNYTSASFSMLNIKVTDFYGTHSYSIS